MSDNEKTPSSILFDSFKNSYINFELDEPSLNRRVLQKLTPFNFFKMWAIICDK